MKKTLLAVGAMLACLGAAQAQSSVQVSGLLDTYVGSMRMAGAAGRTNVVGSGGMTTSWVGFSGTEDLGNGLKATFALNAFLRVDTGAPGRFDGEPFFSRDANVGLTGGFGAVTLGRGKAPNFLPTILLNPFGDSFTVSPLVLHANVNPNANWAYRSTPADTGWSNQITYSTPSLHGLKANLHYQFGEQANASGKRNVGFNVMYANGPAAVMAFYENADINNPVAPNTVRNRKTDWMLGGSYNFDVVKLFATYGQAKEKKIDLKTKTWSLGADIPVNKAGSVKLALAHTKADLAAPAADATRKTYSLGYDHFLSKRTDVYTVAMRDSISRQKSGTSVLLGIRHRF